MDYDKEIKNLEQQIKKLKKFKEAQKPIIPTVNISTEMLNKMKDVKIIIGPLNELIK